jgi:hypothetical protein
MTYQIEDAFMEGFRSGLFWPDQWETHGKPGGPFVCDDQSRKENDAWRKGWEYGHHCKLNGKKPNLLSDPYLHMRE